MNGQVPDQKANFILQAVSSGGVWGIRKCVASSLTIQA